MKSMAGSTGEKMGKNACRVVACLFWMICAALMQTTTLHATVPDAERTALYDLYNATNGDNWTDHSNWENCYFCIHASDPCDDNWYGVTCDSSRQHIIDLDLRKNKLHGPIPPSLGNLTELKDLYLDNNQLTGPIPASLSNLKKLESLWLYDNQLDGTIPKKLGNLTSLKLLWLHNNQLCGPIPATITRLTTLYGVSGLSLHNNNLATTVSPALDAFITEKSGGTTWKASQGTAASCRSSDFPWPLFLPAIMSGNPFNNITIPDSIIIPSLQDK